MKSTDDDDDDNWIQFFIYLRADSTESARTHTTETVDNTKTMYKSNIQKQKQVACIGKY
jgi:hypothetical protein